MSLRRPRDLGRSAAFGGVLFALAALAVITPSIVYGQAVVRVAGYNIRHGRGMDDQVDLPRIAEVLHALDADVITLQKVDDRTERTGEVAQVAVLAELLGYEGLHGPHRPYQGGFYGNAILTRLPVRSYRVHEIPPASGSALAVREVEVELEGALAPTLSVVSVHLAGSEDERMAQADAVTGFSRDRTSPVVLVGDFNGRPGSSVLARLEHDWMIGKKAGLCFTYTADTPDREIDFVMVRASYSVAVFHHAIIPEPMASDHRLLIAVLRIR